MRTIISLLLGVVLCMSTSLPCTAATLENNDTPPQIIFTNSDGELEQHSMSLLTEDELENMLPKEVLEKIVPSPSAVATPYGLNPPSTSNVWNLDNSNYNFTVNMSRGNVYSDYVFTGHDGEVCLTTYDISGNSGSFVGTVMVIRNGEKVFGGNGYLYRGTSSSLSVSGLNSTDKVYFYISVNDGVTTKLDRDGSYLAKVY